MARRLGLLVVVVVTAASVSVPSTVAAPRSEYFFAEGTTRDGFRTDITILNSSTSDISVTAEYQFSDGSPPKVITVTASARVLTFINPASTLGPGVDFSTRLTSASPFSAARVMEIRNKSFGSIVVPGATTALAGIAGPGTDWNLAEGTTLPGFQEYLTIQNPDPARAANISIEYGFEGQPGPVRTLSVPARSRATVDVNSSSQAGAGQTGVSAHVFSTNGVGFIVERPMYFNLQVSEQDTTPGAHIAAGAIPQADQFFAEGNVLAGWKEFLTLSNPAATATTVTVNFLIEGAAPATRTYQVAGHSRYTVQVFTNAPDQGIGRNVTSSPSGGVSMRVQATGAGIVAERPMYAFVRVGGTLVNEGHDAVGQGAQLSCAEFAFSDIFLSDLGVQDQTYVTLANTGPTAVPVHLESFQRLRGVRTSDQTIPAQSRLTLDLTTFVPPGSDEPPGGLRVTAPSGGQFIAEVPFYSGLVRDAPGSIRPRAASVLLPTPC